jgi:NDP-hexose 4-ketoreductase
MDIIGRGFVAQNLRSISDKHSRALVYATGVATTTMSDVHAFNHDTELLYAAIRRCQSTGEQLVFLSTASAAMYGAVDHPCVEDGPVFPTAPYGRHKLAMEQVIERSGIDFLTLRLTNLAGPGQREHQLIPSLVAQVRSGRVRVHRSAYRDVLDIDHALLALDRLLEQGMSREVVNVASGVPVLVEQLVDSIEEQLGTAVERETVDPDGRVSATPVSIDKLRGIIPNVDRLFGLGPRYFDSVVRTYLARSLAASRAA